MTWKSFIDKFKSRVDFESLEFIDAIEMITCHHVEVLKKSKVPVFVFVDEYRRLAQACLKAGAPDPEFVILRAIGESLYSFNRPTVLISTLDYAPLLREGASVTLMICRWCVFIFCIRLMSLLNSGSSPSERVATPDQVHRASPAVWRRGICKRAAVHGESPRRPVCGAAGRSCA